MKTKQRMHCGWCNSEELSAVEYSMDEIIKYDLKTIMMIMGCQSISQDIAITIGVIRSRRS